MKKKLWMLLLLVSAQPLVHAACAQVVDAEAVVRQTLLFVQESLVARGEIGSDAEIVAASEVLAEDYTTGPRHPNAILESMRLAVDAIAPLESVKVCSPDRPGRNKCELRADALLHVGAPSVEGDSATIRVNVWTVTQTGWVQLTGSEIALARRTDGWEVVGRRRTVRS